MTPEEKRQKDIDRKRTARLREKQEKMSASELKLEVEKARKVAKNLHKEAHSKATMARNNCTPKQRPTKYAEVFENYRPALETARNDRDRLISLYHAALEREKAERAERRADPDAYLGD